MKTNRAKRKIMIVIILLLLTTGCAKVLKNENKKAVINEKTGQTLTKNILCQPTNKTTVEIYEKYKVKIEKLPKCDEFKISSGKYEGLWNSIFVKPLAFILLKVGKLVKNYGISVIIISLIIRLVALPVTMKTAKQSELMKQAQPELNRLQKKYEGKKDQESMLKQQQEMMAIYKKYNINPMGSCLFALLQLPIFIAFIEAVQRVPVIFEDKFLGLQLGTTPAVGISSPVFYSYVALILLIAASTYYSFKMNASTTGMEDPTMKSMPMMMTGMIILTGIFMPAGLGIYWVTSNVFTMIQNFFVKRSSVVNGKA